MTTTDQSFEESLLRVRHAMSDLVSYAWRLGYELRLVKEAGLWKPRYRHWTKFCMSEFALNASTADGYIRISKHFTESEVRRFGVGKLALVLKAPELKKSELMGWLQKGVSLRRLRVLATEPKILKFQENIVLRLSVEPQLLARIERLAAKEAKRRGGDPENLKPAIMRDALERGVFEHESAFEKGGSSKEYAEEKAKFWAEEARARRTIRSKSA